MGTTGAVSRAIGLFLPKRSSLRRRSDGIELTSRWVLLLVGLIIVPVALTIGSEVTAALAPQVEEQWAERHQVTATVVARPENHNSARSDVTADDLRAPVRWRAADGTMRVSEIRVGPTARPGDSRVLWVDREDRPTLAPITASYPVEQGLLTTVAILLGDLLISLSLLVGLRWVLDRMRLRAWEAAWRRFTGPDHESMR
ncbi:Rv1733c family protein [Actinomycetospora sp. CA-053990]|uniref:Rv1733c family protein n=1 Tax=Actinomycetospora sp. CA-053990 TaxID=3239891 RepID=UPI003D8C0004